MDTFYPGITSLSPAVLMSDDIIAKIAECGERVTTYEELRRHIRWRLGHNPDTNQPNEKGKLLMDKLADIYRVLNENDAQTRSAEQAKAMEKEWDHVNKGH